MYAFIENGSFVRVAAKPPTSYGQISNFHALSAEDQATHGWRVASIVKPDIDHATQRHGSPSVSISGITATLTYPVEQKPAEEALEGLERAIEQHLDAVAQSANPPFRDRYTCALRGGYPNGRRTEGEAFGAWMDQCWFAAAQKKQDIIDGVAAIPTSAEAIAELPAMVWPE